MSEPPFAPHRHALGPVDLTPLDEAFVEAAAARMAAIDPWARIGVTPEAWAERLRRPSPGAHRFAILRGEALAGVLVVRHPFMRGPYLETIAVFPEAQRLGIARAVVDWMAAEVAGREANVWLCVTEWNAAARAAYAALGFVEIGPIPDLVAVGTAEIFMRRVLAAPADPTRPPVACD